MRAQGALADRRLLRRYLLDGEQVVTAVHQHWGKVAEPVLTALATLVVVLWLDTVLPGTLGFLVSALWWAWLAVLARTAWRLLEWRHEWFVATDKRLLLTYGLITQKVAMMPLKKVTDMTYHRTPMGRVLGYGTFVMESAGEDQALHRISFIPQPDHTYRSICAEIFGVDDHDRAPREPLDDEGDGFGDDGFGDDGFRDDWQGDDDWPGGPGAGGAAPGNEGPGAWHSTEEAHRSIGRDPSQPIPVRGDRPDQRSRQGRSVYRSADLRDEGAARAPYRDDDETGPIPQTPPWPPEEGL